MSTTLPSGWTQLNLGALRADRNEVVDPSKSPDETFELYSIPAFDRGLPEHVRGKSIGSTKKALSPGSVVVSKINPRINRVWVVGPHSGHRQIGSSEWISFPATSGVLPTFLSSFLRRDAFRNHLATNVSGVGGSLMRVRPGAVDSTLLPLAPASEQDRIVAEIESYFTRLDDAERLLMRAHRNLERYRAAVLKAAVEGRLVPTEAELARTEGREHEPASALLRRISREHPEGPRRRKWSKQGDARTRGQVAGSAVASTQRPTNESKAEATLPSGWCWATLDDLASMIEGGNAATAGSIPTSRPVLRSSAVRPGSVDLRDCRYLAEDAPSVAAGVLSEGDLLFTRLSGSLAFVGNCAVVPPLQRARIEFPDRIFRARLLEGVSAEFVSICFGARLIRQQVEEAARSTAGHQRISLSDLRQFRIPLPPVPEQLRIVAAYAEADSIARSSCGGVASALRRHAGLRQSILTWAFDGRLVDQDPTDEPASVLLARIRAERESASVKPAKSHPRRQPKPTTP